MNMIFKLAASSGVWTPNFLGDNAVLFKKEIYDLAGAVLNEYPPYTSKMYWEGIINSAPCNNPCFDPDILCDGGEGWRAPQRWDKYLRAVNGEGGFAGIYNGIDYMLAYNLYRLAFPGAGGVYEPLIDRTIIQNFPYTYQSTLYGTDSKPLTIQAASKISYDGVVSPEGNVVLIAGTEIDLGPSFDVLPGGEFDSYYDYMTCEPNFFPGFGNSTAVLRSGNQNTNTENPIASSAPVSSKTSTIKSKNLQTVPKKEQPDFTLSPNPAKDHIFVNLKQQTISHAEIFNAMGKLCLSIPLASNSTMINVESLTRGIYLVKISSDETVSTKKFVKE